MGEGCDGDLSGEGTGKEEAFRGKGMTHLEEKMKVTVGVGRWDSQSLFGGYGLWSVGTGQKGQLGHGGRIGRAWQKLRPR